MDLRIGAIIATFFSSGIGTLLSWKFLKEDNIYRILIRMFSAGIIITLAFVHVVSESILELSEVVEYPVGGVCVMVGVMALMMIEHLSHHVWTHGDSHNRPPDVESSSVKPEEATGARTTVPSSSHQHTCLNNLTSGTVADVRLKEKTKLLTLYLFEFACVFHSVIIGIALGVTTGRSNLMTLTIAIVFHQLLEGISLGCVMAAAPVTVAKALFMIGGFSLTTPLGVGIGIVIEAFTDPESRESVLIQGCFQGVAGGMLVYVGLIQIVAEEFSKLSRSEKSSLKSKLAMHLAFILGAVPMCVLAIWA